MVIESISPIKKCCNQYPIVIEHIYNIQWALRIYLKKEWLAWCAKETINPPSIDAFLAHRGWNLEFFHSLPPPDFPIASSWFLTPLYFCLLHIFAFLWILPLPEFLPLFDICFLGIFPSPNFCLLFNFHLFLMISASCWHFIINLHHISADHSDSPTKSFRSCFWNKEVFMLLKVEMIRSEAKEGVILDYFIHQLCPEIVTPST